MYNTNLLMGLKKEFIKSMPLISSPVNSWKRDSEISLDLKNFQLYL